MISAVQRLFMSRMHRGRPFPSRETARSPISTYTWFVSSPSPVLSDEILGMHGYSTLRTNLNKDYFHGIYDTCVKMGIEIESHHTETGWSNYVAVSLSDCVMSDQQVPECMRLL